jgi:hypothetical protein
MYLECIGVNTPSHGDIGILFVHEVSVKDAVIDILLTLITAKRDWIERFQDGKVFGSVRECDFEEWIVLTSVGLLPSKRWELTLARD